MEDDGLTLKNSALILRKEKLLLCANITIFFSLVKIDKNRDNSRLVQNDGTSEQRK